MILGGECGFASEWPVDGEIRVVPEDAAFVFRGVVVGGLVQELGHFAGDIEAVGEAFGDPELALVVGAEDDADPLAEGGGAAAQIDGHVKNFAGDDADQFSLGLLDLVVQAAQDAPG